MLLEVAVPFKILGKPYALNRIMAFLTSMIFVIFPKWKNP
jgi:hypothetical protein